MRIIDLFQELFSFISMLIVTDNDDRIWYADDDTHVIINNVLVKLNHLNNNNMAFENYVI